jgi:hypothetical protein
MNPVVNLINNIPTGRVSHELNLMRAQDVGSMMREYKLKQYLHEDTGIIGIDSTI